MKITAQELRTGNKLLLVGDEPEILTVDLIDAVEETINGSGLNDVPLDSLEPIPLTEEWLLKFGFVKATNDSYFEEGTFVKGSIAFEPVNDGFELLWYGDTTTRFVHQLQNLYYALTNSELTIK